MMTGMDTTLASESASASSRVAAGWINGAVGMVIFSASLPATRVAVLRFDPLFLSFARATIAGVLGLAILALVGERRPSRADLLPLAIVAGGVVIGFPVLTAVALRHVTSAHALLFIALLPLTTATFAVLRNGERPQPAFWLFAAVGAAIVLGYAASRDHSGRSSWASDLAMVAAVLFCGLGYAEGGRLSRRLGGWQVICWALVLALPLMLPLAVLWSPTSWTGIGVPAWIGLAYVSLFSMLIGFMFWYRGLALAGTAAVGQLQLVQPFLGLALAATLVREPVDATMLIVAVGAVLCVAGVKRFSAPGRARLR